MEVKSRFSPIHFYGQSQLLDDSRYRWRLPSISTIRPQKQWDDYLYNRYNRESAEKYKNELEALMDIKEHRKEIMNELEMEENKFSNRKSNHNLNRFNENLSNSMLDQRSYLSRPNFIPGHSGLVVYNLAGNAPQELVRCPIGGSGDPLVNPSGRRLTKRTKLVRTIQGSTAADIHASVVPQKCGEEYRPTWSISEFKDSPIKNNYKRVNAMRRIFDTDEEILEKRRNSYRNDLLEEIEKQRQMRVEESFNYLNPSGSTFTTLLSEGRVGKPVLHPMTGFIIPEKRHHTDVTAHTLKFHDIKKPASYISDLQEMAEDRFRLNKEARSKNIDKENEHIATFDNYFDKPGHGARRDDGAFRKSFSEFAFRAQAMKQAFSAPELQSAHTSKESSADVDPKQEVDPPSKSVGVQMPVLVERKNVNKSKKKKPHK